ncbi:DNA polymerase II [Saccharobesus litoralis]|uniref:DNA polymerase n=1 Tax=Saccharobesus litoralis TaxID=2172099 RepID=A0A2S0VXC8_9ALTE|nr:DNA polymerase II [Saccharobesus litoralis]AWB68770.1 DNA polymerase II [Saccharobesus litoralis]
MQQGFLLSRHSQDIDTQQGVCSQIELWLATTQGPVKLQIMGEKPLFFIQQIDAAQAKPLLAKQGIEFEYKSLGLKSFEQQPIGAFYFPTISAHYKAQRVLKKHNIVLFEDDIRLENRYLIERFIQGSLSYIGDSQLSLGHQVIRQAKVKPSEFKPQLSTLSLDIECSMQGELYSIALQGLGVRRVLMIGDAEQWGDSQEFAIKAQGAQPRLDICWVADEKALLLALELHITQLDPDVIIGWNVVNFDFRLLVKRMALYGLTLKLGRGHSAMTWRDNKSAPSQGFVTLPGRVVVDGIDALKTATYQFDSFSLEFVAQALLGRGKKIEDVSNRGEHITHDFLHNKLKLAEYNLEDCQLVSDIFEHTQILDFLILRSQLTGLELDRIGGSVAAFTNVYLPKLHRAGYIAPNLPKGGGLASPGGYVMNSLPGLYKNVLVLDFKSLYPSIIRTFKIDPMGLIEGLLTPEQAIEGFKGGYFSRDKHFLPDIISELWRQRDQAKRDKDAPRSQAIKILMNSFYGVLGSGGCRFYDTRLASSITMRGHQIMQQTAKWIEAQGYKVIYGDTDSTFVWLEGDISPSQAADIGNSLADMINQNWQQTLRDDFALDCYLELEFETHFQRFLMPTIRGSEAGSKKRYAGTVNKNGKIQTVFKGLETVRSDWTELAKEFQTTLYEKVFNDEDVQDYVQKVVTQTLNGERDQQLVYRKRLRQKLSDYVKNVPPHVKAARIADDENTKRHLPLQYDKKAWVKYVLTTQGAQPINYQTANFDYQHYIDKQLKPIADGILPFVGQSFERIIDRQLSLF